MNVAKEDYFLKCQKWHLEPFATYSDAILCSWVTMRVMMVSYTLYRSSIFQIKDMKRM